MSYACKHEKLKNYQTPWLYYYSLNNENHEHNCITVFLVLGILTIWSHKIAGIIIFADS